MDFSINLSFATPILFIALMCRTPSVDTGLTALSDGPFAEQLYQKLTNEDFPSPEDPATGDARSRQRICENVSASGFFKWLSLDPVDVREIYTELQQAKYFHIFRRIYTQTSCLCHPRELTNAFAPRELATINFNFRFDEDENEENPSFVYAKDYVFVCAFRTQSTHSLVFYFVSKEYNVNEGGPRRLGRFLFGEEEPSIPYQHVILAEEPANVHLGPNFNVELHYLEIRKHRQPAENPEDDPVCSMISNNLQIRLCAAVLNAADFKDKIKYTNRIRYPTCREQQISFKTKEAANEAAGKLYHERMIDCFFQILESNERKILKISRAYSSHRVFVYLVDSIYSHNPRVYLENLTVDVSFLIEPDVS